MRLLYFKTVCCLMINIIRQRCALLIIFEYLWANRSDWRCVYSLQQQELQLFFMSNRNQLMRVFSSLSPISEVYSAQSMYIGSKIEYAGLIKRDSGLLSLWNPRNFILRIGDTQKAELSILKSEKIVEEVLTVSQLKLTKKCTVIENLPCFGVVLENGKKYLLAVRNIHDCQRFHAQVTQVKKMEKQLISAGSSRGLSAVMNGSKRNQQMNPRQKIKKQSDQILETNQESEQISESQESERINRRYKKRQLTDSNQQNCQNIFQSTLREEATSVLVESEEYPFRQIQSFFDKNQNTLLDSNLGLMLYPSPQRQKIFINHQNLVKSTVVLMTAASVHACINLFLNFASWNQQVKKVQSLSQTEEGYIIYLQFARGHATSQSRCVVGEVSVVESDYCAALRVRSVRRANYEYLSQKREVKMELLVKVVTDRSNKLQKVMTVALTLKPSHEEFELAVKFLKALREFQQKCKKLI